MLLQPEKLQEHFATFSFAAAKSWLPAFGGSDQSVWKMPALHKTIEKHLVDLFF